MKQESLYRVLIADDELHSRQFVRALIKDDPRFQVVAVCGSGQATVAEAKKTQLDAVFLDIQMPRMDGFEVLKAMQGNSRPLIVFVTAHGDYALKAFENEAFDYVKKPIDPSRFSHVLGRVYQRLNEKKAAVSQPLQSILIDDTRTTSARTLPEGQRILHAVRQDLVYQECEIQFIESASNYINVRIDDESYLVRESLDNFCRELKSSDFVRVHRSFVVNVRWVRKIRYGKSGSAELDLANGHVIPVSRSRRKEVTDILRRLIDSRDIHDDGYVI